MRLIPRDEQFYELFTQLAERLSLAARLLNQLFREPERHAAHVGAIKVAEHEADELTREIIDRLDRTFITPFDREDIHQLASALDEVVDLLDGAARRVEIFRITTVHQAAVTLSDVMVRAAEEVEDCVHWAASPRRPPERSRFWEQPRSGFRSAPRIPSLVVS